MGRAASESQQRDCQSHGWDSVHGAAFLRADRRAALRWREGTILASPRWPAPASIDAALFPASCGKNMRRAMTKPPPRTDLVTKRAWHFSCTYVW